jgi:hypothetical protein
VFGAYDTSPAAPGLVSQYRNLVHHAVHQAEAGEAASFWAGLGAVRAEWFARVGGFDAARYPRPSVEDVELGYRLRRAGARIRLRPEIQGTHLKRWTLRGGARTDVLDRGVPWARLILARETPPNGLTLNVRPRERVLTALAAAPPPALLAALATGDWLWLVAALGCLAPIPVLNRRLLAFFARERGPAFAAAVVPLRVLYYLLNGVSTAVALGEHARAALGRPAVSGVRGLADPTARQYAPGATPVARDPAFRAAV